MVMEQIKCMRCPYCLQINIIDKLSGVSHLMKKIDKPSLKCQITDEIIEIRCPVVI